MPYFKLGLIYCLNRPTSLYHLREPAFDKKKLAKEGSEDAANYIRRINPDGEYMAM